MDEMASIEIGHLLVGADILPTKPEDDKATLSSLAELFADAYRDRLGDNAPRRITPDDLDDMADTFRDLLGEHYRV